MEDEQAAREAATFDPQIAQRLGLDAEIPADLPALRLPGTTIELRRWPLVYVTTRTRIYSAIWTHVQAGRPPLTDGVLLWPARLVTTLAAIDAWPPLGSRRHG